MHSMNASEIRYRPKILAGERLERAGFRIGLKCHPKMLDFQAQGPLDDQIKSTVQRHWSSRRLSSPVLLRRYLQLPRSMSHCSPRPSQPWLSQRFGVACGGCIDGIAAGGRIPRQGDDEVSGPSCRLIDWVVGAEHLRAARDHFVARGSVVDAGLLGV